MTARILAILAAALALPAAAGIDVNVIGLFSGRAVVVVNRGAPRTLRVGERTPEGVLLVSADSRAAVVEVDGQRLTLELGQHFEAPGQSDSRTNVTLSSDARGHFMADGAVNGAHVRFLVDTGATFVSIPARDASRLRIDMSKGQRGYTQTANGRAAVWRVLLDSVTLGGITLYNVTGLVHESDGLDVALLGMSFLNRTEMRREGQNLTLTKRY